MPDCKEHSSDAENLGQRVKRCTERALGLRVATAQGNHVDVGDDVGQQPGQRGGQQQQVDGIGMLVHQQQRQTGDGRDEQHRYPRCASATAIPNSIRGMAANELFRVLQVAVMAAVTRNTLPASPNTVVANR
ncbi:hypothetical protein D3C76_1390140 [compost metagenome]